MNVLLSVKYRVTRATGENTVVKIGCTPLPDVLLYWLFEVNFHRKLPPQLQFRFHGSKNSISTEANPISTFMWK